MTSLGAHQHEIGHVRAPDEQHNPNRAHHDPQHPGKVADYIPFQRLHRGRESEILEDGGVESARDGPRGQPTWQHPVDVRVGLCERDPGAQAGEAHVRVVAEMSGGTVELIGQEQIGVRRQEPEVARHHADDLARPPIHVHGAPDHRGVSAVLPLPVPMREQGRLGRPWRIVCTREDSPQLRGHPEGVEHAMGDQNRGDALGTVLGHDRRARRPQPEPLECRIRFGIAEEHRR